MWKDITIRTYQKKLYPIISRKICDESDELDQEIDICILFEGKDKAHYDNMVAAEFIEVFRKYDFILAMPKPTNPPQFIEVRGIKFACDYNPANVKNKLRARDLIDLSTISKDQQLLTDNMHRILAAYMVEEKKRGKERMELEVKEEWMKDCDMQTAWDILSFFFVLLENCSIAILSYLSEQPQKMKEELKENLSPSIGDGMQH